MKKSFKAIYPLIPYNVENKVLPDEVREVIANHIINSELFNDFLIDLCINILDNYDVPIEFEKDYCFVANFIDDYINNV